jgi:N-acetylglutamate synthase-like GNAT family acetyltransferase
MGPVPDALRIRPATLADAPAIGSLVEEAYGHYVERIGKRPAPMDEDYAEVVRHGHTWVAEEAGTLAGVLVLVPASDHLLIENVAVAPGWWGRGVGRRLLELAEERAREAGLAELRLYTNARMTENRAYYARRGYRETGRQLADGFDRVYFTKPAHPNAG